ncbi:hypothetical protein Ancab_037803 [Ancistrocladus abbreviatus]
MITVSACPIASYKVGMKMPRLKQRNNREETSMATLKTQTRTQTRDPNSSPIISEGMPDEHVTLVTGFLSHLGISDAPPETSATKDFYSDLLSGLLKVDSITRGRVMCSFSVIPAVANHYGGLHGGAVAAVAERMAVACARTVVGAEKELFLGELRVSYLSSAQLNVELVADGSLVKSGRNITVISVEFRVKTSGKLAYTAHATFYNMPAPKL